MVKYFYLFKLAWMERMAYRVNFFMEILSGIFSSLIVIFLWIAIYRYSGRESLGDYKLQEMVTYLIGGGLINSFILTTAENPETSQNIQDGTLSTFLIKPLNPYGVWLSRDLGHKAFFFLLGLIGYGFVSVFFKDYILGFHSWTYFLVFLFSLLSAAFLQFLIFESFSLLSFWIENTYGIRFTMRVIMEIAAGAIIPLSFFPKILNEIFLFLPFSYLIYYPMNIYLGKVTSEEIFLMFLKQGVWVIGLVLLNLMILKKGIRQYVAMGD